MPGNHPLQQNQYIGCFDRAVSMKNVALPRIVIDDAENTQFAATLSLRAQMFFSKASSRAFIFRSWSASCFLSSVFSLSSSFNLRASFTFVPPYLLLHR